MPSDVDKGRFLASELKSKGEVLTGNNHVEGKELYKQISKVRERQIYHCIESR